MSIEDCLIHLRELTQSNPGHADAWNNLGLVLSCEGRHEEALEAFAAALRINPEYLEAGISRSFTLADLGRVPEGFREFGRLRARNCDDFDIVLALGVFCLRAGWKENGLPQLRRAEGLKPGAPWVAAFVAAALAADGDEDAARDHLERVRTTFHFRHFAALSPALSPERFDAELYRAWFNPFLVRVPILIAEFMSGAGLPVRAEEILRQANSQFPGHADLLVEMGKLVVGTGRPDDAAAWFSAALTADDHSHAAYFELSFLHAAGGRLEEAAACLEAAVSLRPLYPDYRYHLGTALADLGRLEPAITELERVLTLNSSYGHAALHLANAHLESGRPELALAVLEKAGCEEWPEALVLAAQAHLRAGKRADALRLVGRALDADSSYGDAESVLAQLEVQA
jgi:tetratricopeptide (TPR) repeat protein